jgi:hypothetical protein
MNCQSPLPGADDRPLCWYDDTDAMRHAPGSDEGDPLRGFVFGFVAVLGIAVVVTLAVLAARGEL